MAASDNANIAQRLLAEAKKAGADNADLVIVGGAALSCSVRDGEIEQLDRAEGDDLGLRVFVGQSQAIVSTSSFGDDNLAALAERGVAMAKLAPPDPLIGLAPIAELAVDIPALDLADNAAPESAELMEIAKICEQAGLDVEGVEKSGSATARAARREVYLATSTGFAAGYARTTYGISASMVAGSGTNMESDYDYSASLRFCDLSSPEEIGKKAGERAARSLNPRKISSTTAPVIFDDRTASSLVSHFAGAINGASVARGTSFLKDAMDKPVFAPGITITDDPHKIRGLASRPFDGEGRGAQKLDLIADGHLRHWLLDGRSSAQLGLVSNGRARRGTDSPPSPSASNLYLHAGTVSQKELMRQAGRGLLITSLIGMGVNNVTGDYSRGASGFWFEDGEILYPVNEITIASTLPDIYAGLIPANDLAFTGAVNAPSCLIAEMVIAGR